MKSLAIQDRPYSDSPTCEIPKAVPTKMLIYTVVGFFLVSTLSIIAFMRYDDTHVVLRSHHDAEVNKLVTEVQALRQVIKDKEAETDLKVERFIASLKKQNIPELNSILHKKELEWKQVREPVQLEGGIDDGYELVEISK